MQKLRDAWQQHRILETINRPHLKKSHLGWVIVGVLAAGMSFNATVVQAAPDQSTNIVETDKTTVAEAKNVDPNSFDIKTDVVEKTTENTATEKTVSTDDVDKATATKMEVQATADQSVAVAGVKNYQLRSVITAATGNLASGRFGTSAWTISADGTLHIGAGEFAAANYSSPWSRYAYKIKKIVFDGNVVANTDSHNLFKSLKQVTSIEGLNKLDTHQVTDMSYMFYGMYRLTSLDLSNFNTSQVTDMSNMFNQMSSLASLDLSKFNTSKVANMDSMFNGLSSLTSLDVSNFNTSQVTNMSGMFSKMSSLTSLYLSDFNTSQVTDMSSMFYGMSSLTSLDLSKFNTSKVTTMGYMFLGMSSLTSLDLSKFDTSKVTNMISMFDEMSKLNQIKFGANFDTSAVTSDSAVLPNVAGIKQWRQVGSGTVDKPAGAVRSSATINKTNPVVADTYILSTYIVVDFWKPNADANTSNNIGTYGAVGLENYISSADPFGNGNVKYVNDLTAADQTEVLAKGVFGTAKWYIGVDGTLHIGAGEFAATSYSSPWSQYAGKIKKIVFDGAVAANANSSFLFANLNQVMAIEGLNKLDTRQVTNMSFMFDGMSSLTSLDLSNFDTHQVTNISYMFREMSSLTSLDLSNFDTHQVTRMNSMFRGMSSLTSLDLSGFDTSKVTDMRYMFYVMSKLTSLNVSNFKTIKVTKMDAMFSGMSSLTSLDVSNFDTSQVTNMSYMFKGMSSLTSLDLSNFDTSKVTKMSSMFEGMSKLNQIRFGANFDTSAVTSDSAVLPNVAGIKQWRQVGSGTVDKPTGAFRNSAKIDTNEPVVADTYVLDTHTVVDFWKPSSDANTYTKYGVSGLENYISSTDPFGNGNVKYVHELTAADQTEVLAKGIFGTVKWYISMDGTLHIGAGEFAATSYSSPWSQYAGKIKKIVFDGAVVANADSSSLFGNLNQVTAIEGLNKLDTHQVTNMVYMFYGMSSLTSLDLSNFDTSQVTNMSYMFNKMSSLTSLDASNFDTSRVTNMPYMFYGMSSLTSLDVSNFNTSRVTSMKDMFYGMSKLNQIRFGANFDTSASGSFAVFPNVAGIKQWRQVGSGTVAKPAGKFRNSATINTTEPVVADTYVLGTYTVVDFWKSNADANTYGVAGLENYISSTDPFGNGNVKYVHNLIAADQTEVLAKGIFGTAKWYISMDGTLHIGAGEFAAPTSDSLPSSPWSQYADKIKKIVFDGVVVANADSTGLFKDLRHVTSIESLNKLDTHQVTNMSFMFNRMSSLTSLDVSNFDTSQVTRMNSMFQSMSSLTSLNVSNFDTSQVTDMYYMFAGMSNLTSFDLSNFNTSKVTNMSYMFSSMSRLTSLDVSDFDTSQVTDTGGMFSGMSSLTSLDVSNFDTSQVTDMSSMFKDMSRLTSLDVSNFKTIKVTNMYYMFSGMSSLTSLDVSNFDTSQVKYMYDMFSGVSNLTSLDLSNFNTSKVTKMSSMFEGMSKLKQIRFGANFDTSAAGSFLPSLPNAGIKQWRQVGSGTVDKPAGTVRSSATINKTNPVVADTYVLGTYIVADFWKPNTANTYGVAGLENYISSTDPFGNGNVKYINDLTAADQTEVLAKGIFGTAKWYIGMDGVLHIGAGGFAATNYSSPWSRYANTIKKIVFDGAVVANTDSSSLFVGLNQVTSIEGLNKLDTHQITNMSYMFGSMSSLTSLDVSNFDTSKVVYMESMFKGMSKLASLNLSNFNTSKVTNMIYMFYGMSSLTSLDLSKFDTRQVTNMRNMFGGMSKLNQIKFGANFDTSAAGSDSADLPNVAGIKQWRQVGSGTVDKPTGAFRNSANINTTEPVVADTYVLTDKTQQYVITVKDDTGDLMPNVKLGFYDKNGNLVATVETDANGVASVSLPIYDYTVKQVSDVKNHDAADNLNVLQDNPTGTMTLSWQTTSSNMLPVTGSQGMLAMMTAGLVLLFGLLGFSLKKNKKDLQ